MAQTEDTTPPREEYISQRQFIQAIGYISAELAHVSGAWDGEAPEWFPEPPEWLALADDALAATATNVGNELLEESDAMVWAEAFVDTVHKNPSIAFDTGTMVGWFANAFTRGEWNSEAYKRELKQTLEDLRERERYEHPLYFVTLDPADADEWAAQIFAVVSEKDNG